MTTLSAVSSSQERAWERPLALLLSLLALGYALVWLVDRAVQIRRAEAPVALHLLARLPEDGGWTGDPLRVVAGQPVQLHIRGVEGVHALHIARMDVETSLILPGQSVVLDFTAPEPGRYVIQCTVWCGRDHWRMRTVLDVTPRFQPDAGVNYFTDPRRYAFDPASLDMDAPHPAAMIPPARPDAHAGGRFWAELRPQDDPAGVLLAAGWPLIAPDDFVADLAELSEQERWDVTAFLWRQMVSAQDLAAGRTLYDRDCASCHGPTGAGDGFDAGSAPAPVPSFRDAATGLGASPALLYAKIARGGMGTGMPNWGTIYTEDDLWAVTALLLDFQFDPILGLSASPAPLPAPPPGPIHSPEGHP